jgi:putative salt-induced outer membrane protein YdiY
MSRLLVHSVNIKIIITICAVAIIFFPSLLLAAEELELKDIKSEIKKQHKKEIKKELEATQGEYNFDLSKNAFSSETRVGVTNMTGNTRSIAVNGTNITKYRHKRVENTWNAGAFYSRVFSSVDNSSIGTSARYIYGNYRLDYYILQRLTVFFGGGGYTNEIKGMKLAGQGFTGLKYFFLMNPNYYFSGSIGYNYTYEDVMPPDKSKQIHSAALMLDYEHKLADNLKIEEHLEVLEDAENGKEIRVNSNTSIKVMVTKHIGFALGFLMMFDNQPPTGYKKVDTITNFSLAITL